MGHGLIAMSRKCVAHAYDDELNCILEASLYDSLEVRALQQRLEINSSELKDYIRCISLACDNSRYLFTGMDEAFCMDMNSRGIWELKIPQLQGWSRVAETSNMLGTSAEIVHALDVMKLSLPYTVEDLKQS